MIKITVEPKNIHTGYISVDSSLNVKGQNNHYNWLINPGSEIVEITRGNEVVTCPAKEIVLRINKLLKPFNSIKLNISTYCIKVSDIQQLPGASTKHI